MKRRVILADEITRERIDHARCDVKEEELVKYSADEGVKVTDIQAKHQVWKGTEVPVLVTVTNYGAYPRTVEVTLEDNTKNVFLGARTITLAPRDSQVMTFNWKTKRFSLGDHVLYAQVTSCQEQLEPPENSWRARSEKYYYETDESKSHRLSSETEELENEALAEAYDILQMAECELEDVKSVRAEVERYREQAEEETTRTIDEVYDQLNSATMKELHRTRAARAEAEEARLETQRELDMAEAIREKVEHTTEQIVVEAREKADKLYPQLLLEAEQQAKGLREESSRQSAMILAEAEEARLKAQSELDAAEALRNRVEGFAEKIISEARQQVDVLYQQLILKAEQPASDFDNASCKQSEGMPAKEKETADVFPRHPVDNKAIKAEIREQTVVAPESTTTIDSMKKPQDRAKGILSHWEWIVIILALVVAAVMFSLGLFLI